MSDLIDRQAAIDALSDEITITGVTNAIIVKDYVQRVKRKLENLPSAQPERKSGKWVRGDAEKLTCSARCSICQNRVYEERSPYKFCPNCGAKMEGEQNG